ncbi:MAG: tRNA pseudouridine(38-40) synthase TruA [Thermoplasmata archaeon]|nr:tRNA pseudouridine(38-40) synthase TruA [Thermoplasmata archaeon]
MYLLKFGYDGTKFDSFSFEKNRYTVLGEILKILKEYNISDNVYTSSRTDRNVSAIGNVIGIISSDNINKIMGILNSKTKYMLFHSYAIVENDFKPRYAKERWYRYFLFNRNFNIDEMEKKATQFIGEHDFSNFSRKDERKSVRKIFKIEIKSDDDFIIIDVRGQSFLWNMVRRIIGFLAYGEGDPYSNVSRYIVPAENLVLMDVIYDFNFKTLPVNKNFLKDYWKIRTSLFIYREFNKISEGRWGIEPQ